MIKINKIFAVFAIVLCLVLGQAVTAFASETGTVTSSTLNIRATASAKAKILGVLKKGAKITILKKESSWYHIQSGKTKGWVSKSYVSLKSTVASRGDEIDGSAIVSHARAQLGKPYIYGATGSNAFDCSGLTQYVYKKAGINIARTSSSQALQGSTVSRGNLQAGDLVFFKTGGSSYISHVGIYIGNGKMIHSPKPGDVVKVSSLLSGYVTAKRIL